jgi:hypothetical protein
MIKFCRVLREDLILWAFFKLEKQRLHDQLNLKELDFEVHS